MRTKPLFSRRREKTVMRKMTLIGNEYTVEYRLTGTPLRPGRGFGTAYTVYAVMRDSMTGDEVRLRLHPGPFLCRPGFQTGVRGRGHARDAVRRGVGRGDGERIEKQSRKW